MNASSTLVPLRVVGGKEESEGDSMGHILIRAYLLLKIPHKRVGSHVELPSSLHLQQKASVPPLNPSLCPV